MRLFKKKKVQEKLRERKSLHKQNAKFIKVEKTTELSPIYNSKIHASSHQMLPLYLSAKSMSFFTLACDDYVINYLVNKSLSKSKFLILRIVLFLTAALEMILKLFVLPPGKLIDAKAFSLNPKASFSLHFFFGFWCVILNLLYFDPKFFALLETIDNEWSRLGLASSRIVRKYIMKKVKFLKNIIFIVLMACFLQAIIEYIAVATEKREFFHSLMHVFSLLVSVLNSSSYVSSVYQLGLVCIFVESSFFLVQFILRYLTSASAINIQTLRRHREVHTYTIDLLNTANKFWKVYLFFFYLTLLPMEVTIFYNLLYVRFNLTGYFGLFLTFLTQGPFFIYITKSLTQVNFLASSPHDDIYTLTFINSQEEFQSEAQLFLDRIARRDAGFTLLNMFLITPNIASTMLTVGTTLLVAIPSL